MTCEKAIAREDYLQSDEHSGCRSQIRPAIVLYEEILSDKVVEQSIKIISEAELIGIVGISFLAHPFCDLIRYASKKARILVINQPPVYLEQPYYFFMENALNFF